MVFPFTWKVVALAMNSSTYIGSGERLTKYRVFTETPFFSLVPYRPGKMKYVIVSGGTVSGLGKGTAISSLGVLLKHHGYKVTALKIDPYLVS